MSHRHLAHNRDFTALWIGQVVSELGTRISLFVFPLIAYAITGSAVQAAFAESVHLLGMLIALLPAGVLADRYDRKRLMRISAGLGALLYTALIASFAIGEPTLIELCVVAFGTGLLGGLFAPAEMSAVRDVVSNEDLPAAISQQTAREYVASLIGAPLGGVLYTLGRAVPFVVDAVSYAVSFVMLGRIRADLSPRPDARDSDPRRDLTDGFRFIAQRPFFRVIVAWGGLCNLTINALIYVCVLRMIQDGVPPVQIALVEATLGVAGVLGAVVAPFLVERVPTGQLAILETWLFVPALVPMVLWPSPIVIALAIGLPCFLNPAGNAAIGAYRLLLTPTELVGRVQAAARFVSMSMMPIAPVLAGVALHRLGGSGALVVMGICLALTALLPTLARSVRTIPRPAQWRQDLRQEARHEAAPVI